MPCSTATVLRSNNVSVSEDMEVVSVCVTVERPQVDCPIDYPFTIIFSTIDDEAGGFEFFGSCKDAFHFVFSSILKLQCLQMILWPLKPPGNFLCVTLHSVSTYLSMMTQLWRMMKCLK